LDTPKLSGRTEQQPIEFGSHWPASLVGLGWSVGVRHRW